jgi:hypothetical protein
MERATFQSKDDIVWLMKQAKADLYSERHAGVFGKLTGPDSTLWNSTLFLQ